jgi:hypothetical protein
MQNEVNLTVRKVYNQYVITANQGTDKERSVVCFDWEMSMEIEHLIRQEVNIIQTEAEAVDNEK